MKKIVSVLLAISLMLGAMTLLTGCAECIKYSDEDSYSTGPLNTPDKNITAVEIYWTSGAVEINGVLVSQLGVSGVTVWEDYTATNDNTVRTRVVNGVLQIYPAASGTRVEDIPKKTLKVELPLDVAYALESVSVTVLGDAKVSLNKVNPKSLSLSTKTGDVMIDGTPASASITTVSGNLVMTSINTPEYLRFASETGNATLAVPLYGFAAVMEEGMGQFVTDYEVTENGNIYSTGTQATTFAFRTAGTVTLNRAGGAK